MNAQRSLSTQDLAPDQHLMALTRASRQRQLTPATRHGGPDGRDAPAVPVPAGYRKTTTTCLQQGVIRHPNPAPARVAVALKTIHTSARPICAPRKSSSSQPSRSPDTSEAVASRRPTWQPGTQRPPRHTLAAPVRRRSCRGRHHEGLLGDRGEFSRALPALPRRRQLLDRHADQRRHRASRDARHSSNGSAPRADALRSCCPRRTSTRSPAAERSAR
jgi:hypothetical protein